jgi:FtsP/CotA-like multicopper oxidase with cupredoxin domain
MRGRIPLPILRAAAGPTIVADPSLIGSTYEGTFASPTLKVRPGDFLQIELTLLPPR